MKKIMFFLFILGGFLLISRPALAQEQINHFDATIRINADASINVQEKIEYDFGSLEKHGIYRNIPIKYQARGGNYKLRISEIWVTDENGDRYSSAISYPGNDIQIKIGDPDVLVTGVKTYIISYKIKRAINFFDTYDELYWNVTGDEWPVSIEDSSAVIILPQAVAEESLKKDCFAGPLGSTAKCDLADYQKDSNGLARNIIFENGFLAANEGLTVVVGLPKGLVTQPSKFEVVLETLKDNWVLFVPFLVLGLLIYLWRTRGRDPMGQKTIIAQYDPPENLSPAEVGTVVDETANKKDISAEIIQLAVKGYLKIVKEEGKGIFKKEDFVLEKLKESDGLPNNFEKKLLDSLFSGDKKSVKLSDLKNKFYKDLEEIKNQVYDSTASKKYFVKNPKKVRNTYLIIGVSVLFLGFFVGSVFGAFGVLSFIASAVVIIIFSFFMPAKTRKGVLTKEHILGLKLYLSVAEKERLKFHNAPASLDASQGGPEKNPEQFEKLLPYAIVLGVEKEWAKQFEGIYTSQPSWYSDPTGRAFNTLLFVSAINSFTTQANSTLASTPSKGAASGGSGFGSGGFSGGGFGGGGGGSW